MTGEVVNRIPKPVLRGLHAATIKTNLIVAGVLCFVSVVGVKYIHNEPKKQDYANYYKNIYDEKKVLTRMVENGLLDSIKSVDEI